MRVLFGAIGLALSSLRCQERHPAMPRKIKPVM